ncbi:glutathione S-transferase family protein [Hoeflea sp. AS60]|uniref:glutathione S-transferase family protein n=1 Tax=Hoeflea sp. AS60 TaxID=3135780 RepID=UPI0031715F79
MLTIYAIAPSLYCAKLRILLRHKQLTWEEVPPPGGYGSDEYKRLIASGNLPAMVDGDITLADSEAIAEYLNELHPRPQMLPDAPAARAKVRELSRFHDTRLEPALRVLFAHIGADERDNDVQRRQSDALSARLAQLGKMLGEREDAGHTLTLADCGFPISFEWIERLDPVFDLRMVWPDAVVAYRERLSALPAIAAELNAYRPVLDGWLAKAVLGRDD